ncbi:MAG: threonyl-tRNA synthetase editing domain-containing protein [Desulfobulbales bacterium]|nr:threonyl-tRNA synthetase editing domain-containing protein [Desulfobulbales bacterium]
MKLLLFYAHAFSYETAAKSLASVPDINKEESVNDAAVIFFHVEAEDVARRSKVVQKFVKNVKWLCGKFSTRNVVLHSFNHLSGSKAEPEFSQGILNEVTERLVRTEFKVMVTPFGYFNEFKIHVAGDSLAKVFKEF